MTRLMADRFGVTVQHPSCFTTQAEVSFRAGYNHTLAAHIDRVFGEGAYSSVLDEVDRYREEQYRRWLDSHQSGQV